LVDELIQPNTDVKAVTPQAKDLYTQAMDIEENEV
jgi:hypothetical protein